MLCDIECPHSKSEWNLHINFPKFVAIAWLIIILDTSVLFSRNHYHLLPKSEKKDEKRAENNIIGTVHEL